MATPDQKIPAAFDLARVEAGIAGTRFSGRVRHFAVTDSTNQLAIVAANAGARESVWVADEQTAGRGRGGHQWHSSPGDGLYISMLVFPRGNALLLPMAAGLAVQAAVAENTGIQLDLRWPNDLMLGDAKCGGILVESASTSDGGLRWAVIGIGLNLNHSSFPPELAGVATSLHLQGGRHFEREPIVISLLQNIEREVTWIRRDIVGAHNSRLGLYARFTAASTWVSGKRVRVGEQGGYTGTTRGLDSRGFLLVEDDHGTLRTVLSGGVRPE